MRMRMGVGMTCLLLATAGVRAEGMADAEVRRLQEDVASLRREVETLKAEVAALKGSKAPLAATPSFKPPTAPAAPVLAPATPVITEEAEKAYASCRPILETMPQDLWPNPKDGWDKFNREKPYEWINLNVQGKWFEIRQSFAPNARRIENIGGIWYLTVRHSGEKFNFHGVNVNTTIMWSPFGGPGHDCVSIPLTENWVKRLEKEKFPITVKVRFQVQKAHASPDFPSDPHQMQLKLDPQNISVVETEPALKP